MKKLFWILMVSSLIALLAACGSTESASTGSVAEPASADAVQVEIISLDHSPIRPAVQEVADVVAEFGEAAVLIKYNFDTPEGDAFAEEHGLEEHTPIVIYINGESKFEVDGRSVQFYSFPQGGGTGMVAEGVWTMDDLRAVLEQETN